MYLRRLPNQRVEDNAFHAGGSACPQADAKKSAKPQAHGVPGSPSAGAASFEPERPCGQLVKGLGAKKRPKRVTLQKLRETATRFAIFRAQRLNDLIIATEFPLSARSSLQRARLLRRVGSPRQDRPLAVFAPCADQQWLSRSDPPKWHQAGPATPPCR
jgi:hypothetical protein